MRDGKGAPLTRERILAAALDIVDREGVDGLSIRRLGARLRVNGVSLYYHFSSKTEILDCLVAEVMRGVDLAPEERRWPVRLRRIHVSLREALLSHPNLLPVAVTRPYNTPEAVAVSEAVLETLLRAGFAPDAALDAFNSLRAFVIGSALCETAGLLGEPPTWNNRDRMTLQEIGEHGFTNVLHVIPAAAVADHGRMFLAGLDTIISGLEARLSGEAGLASGSGAAG